MDEATRRLLFWLKVPYVADVGLGVIGAAMLATGNGIGWWVLLFAALRAIVGTVALFWLAPRLIAKRRDEQEHGDRDGSA